MTIDRSSLEPGYQLPPFERTPGFHHWNRYAAVNSEFVDIHMDDGAGQAAGYPGAIGMGNLTIAWFHAMLESWLGTEGKLVSFSGQFRSPALRGDTITCTATVSEVAETDDGTLRVTFELAATNQRDEQMMPGSAVVDLTV